MIGKLPHSPNFSFGTEDVPNEENAHALRGLLWLTQVLPRRDELARAITAVALSAYRKVPRIGCRAVRVGNAAVYALSEMGSTDAVGQLAVLKVRVKSARRRRRSRRRSTRPPRRSACRATRLRRWASRPTAWRKSGGEARRSATITPS